jgi:site-specific recombinase XerD
VTAYRVAIDDLVAWMSTTGRERAAFREGTVVEYLHDYRERRQPAPATYYRRFTLLRRFYRWLAAREGVADPFLELDPSRGRRPTG